MTDEYDLKPGEMVLQEFDGVARVGNPEDWSSPDRLITKDGEQRRQFPPRRAEDIPHPGGWLEEASVRRGRRGEELDWEELPQTRRHWEELRRELIRRFGTNPSNEEPVIPISVVMEGRAAVAAYLYVVYGLSIQDVADWLEITDMTATQYCSMFIGGSR